MTVTSSPGSSVSRPAKSLYRRVGRLGLRAVQRVACELRKSFAPAPAPGRFLIFDDIFPHELSTFRFAEYSAYLRHFPSAEVLTTGTALPLVGETRSIGSLLDDYTKQSPEFVGRVRQFSRFGDMRASLLYGVFIHNALTIANRAEAWGSPFAFTLYPGGGLRFGDDACDSKLRRIFNSPQFRKVIVTQEPVRAYLLENRFCSETSLEFIYGGLYPTDRLLSMAHPRTRFPADKKTIDICFVANKYMAGGLDKGYDLFVEAARILSSERADMRFHVVGPYNESDADLADVRERFLFYGMQTPAFFPKFYSCIDIFLSPNRAGTLAKGAFDGFPTGACMEAGAAGVAMFCTDPLKMNVAFTDGRDIAIVLPDAQQIAATVSRCLTAMPSLYSLADAGRDRCRQVFCEEAQLAPRIRLMESLLTSQQTHH